MSNNSSKFDWRTMSFKDVAEQRKLEQEKKIAVIIAIMIIAIAIWALPKYLGPFKTSPDNYYQKTHKVVKTAEAAETKQQVPSVVEQKPVCTKALTKAERSKPGYTTILRCSAYEWNGYEGGGATAMRNRCVDWKRAQQTGEYYSVARNTYDPVFEYGTLVKIAGIPGIGVIDDNGPGVRGLDIAWHDRADAFRFGLQDLKVEVVGRVKL